MIFIRFYYYYSAISINALIFTFSLISVNNLLKGNIYYSVNKH